MYCVLYAVAFGPACRQYLHSRSCANFEGAPSRIDQARTAVSHCGTTEGLAAQDQPNQCSVDALEATACVDVVEKQQAAGRRVVVRGARGERGSVTACMRGRMRVPFALLYLGITGWRVAVWVGLTAALERRVPGGRSPSCCISGADKHTIPLHET